MERLASFAGAVEAQVSSGDLDPDAGRDLLRTLGGIAAAVQKGRNAKAVERLGEVEKRLAELRRDGKLSPAGFDALNVVGPIKASLT